jgi:methionyl-tRNA formyltransferase
VVLQQDAEQGNTYYVIHPVLKHLALLSLPEV